MSKGNIIWSAARVFEEWTQGTLKMASLCSGFAGLAFVGLTISVGTNLSVGFQAADYATSIALLLLLLLGMGLYFIVRYIDAKVTLEEQRCRYERRLLDPKTLEDMITAEGKSLFDELRKDTELEIARIIAIPAKKLQNEKEARKQVSEEEVILHG